MSFFYRTISHEPSDVARKHWFYVNQTGWYRCKSDYETFYESYYDYHLFYVIEGKGYIQWGHRVFEAGPGDVVLLDMHRPQYYRADTTEPWEFYWVHFGFEHFKTYFDLLNATDNPVSQITDRARTEQQFRDLFQQFEAQVDGSEPRASLLLNRIVTELMDLRMQQGAIAGYPQRPDYPQSVRQAISFMEHHFTEPMKLEDIASVVNLSAFHFARVFRRETSSTVMEYLTRIRLKQAKNLLFHTNLAIGEVAEQVGFKDQAHFCRVFKQYENVTPTSYRTNKNHKTPNKQ